MINLKIVTKGSARLLLKKMAVKGMKKSLPSPASGSFSRGGDGPAWGATVEGQKKSPCAGKGRVTPGRGKEKGYGRPRKGCRRCAGPR